MTDRTAEAVLAGSVTSTQAKFPATLDIESAAELDFWRAAAPELWGMQVTIVADGARICDWSGKFARPAQSVDQRTVFSAWLDHFVRQGGNVELVGDLGLRTIDDGAGRDDLTVVTRGSREVLACFPIDDSWNLSSRPLRQLSVLYLDGVAPHPERLGHYLALPGIGEIISYAALTGPPGRERACEILLFEAIPGQALDVFDSSGDATERLRQARRLLDEHIPPDIADRYRHADLTDAGATLVGAVTPHVRQAVGTLPSGRSVLGGGDVVVRMDPGGAQGANNAVHCAATYAQRIVAGVGDTNDREWMMATAEPWLTGVAYPAARWTMTVLEPPAPLQELMLTAAGNSALADAFVNVFVRPANLPGLLENAESSSARTALKGAAD
ncbi:styrene monooxygenase/indole monooxygenase family protein [Nocardia sp. CA-135953]|uniref:styrene monooxygenase/indole monooxygenase family protein n=1 Tax=Nocardia sp. CA-135953 TaxID=3239978 RepID=UPI003D967A70